MKINLNESIEVVLTDRGRELCDGMAGLRRDGQILRCQLWELLAFFGPSIPRHPTSLGLPFVDNTIELLEHPRLHAPPFPGEALAMSAAMHQAQADGGERLSRLERAFEALLEALENEPGMDRDSWFRDELQPAVQWARRELKP